MTTVTAIQIGLDPGVHHLNRLYANGFRRRRPGAPGAFVVNCGRE
jgi:hypothetical protein